MYTEDEHDLYANVEKCIYQVLKFDAWYQQTVHESPKEHFRVRRVSIYYYLEDDSISVVEPHVENSGLPQGGNYWSVQSSIGWSIDCWVILMLPSGAIPFLPCFVLIFWSRFV